MKIIKRIILLLFCLNALCEGVQAKKFLRNLDMKNLEKYGVRVISDKQNLYNIDSKTRIIINWGISKYNDKWQRSAEIDIFNKDSHKEAHIPMGLADKNKALIYITKDSKFPFNGKEPGLYTCELDLSYNDTIASTLVLGHVFTKKNITSCEYILNEETCGFMWVEKVMWDNNFDHYNEVYDPSMKKLFSLKKNSHVYFEDLHYMKNTFYYGYEGILFYVMNDDFSEELFSVEGKRIYKSKNFHEIEFIASRYEHNYQSIGFYYFNDNDIRLFDCNGKFVKKISSVKHNYISEIGQYLPSKSKSFLANKNTDINKLLNRNNIYEGNGLFQYLVNYDEDKIGEYKLKAGEYIKQRKFKKAASYYGKAFELSKSGIDLFNRGIAYFNAGKYHQAIADFQNCLTFSDIDDDVMTRAPRLINESKEFIAEKAERRERILNSFAYSLSQMGQNGNIMYNNANNSYSYVPRFNFNTARSQIYSDLRTSSALSNFQNNFFSLQNNLENFWKKYEDQCMVTMRDAFEKENGRVPNEDEEKQLRAMVQDAIARGIADFNSSNPDAFSISSRSSSSTSSSSSQDSDSERKPLVYLEEYDCTFCAGTGNCKWCKDGWIKDVGKNYECPNCYAPLKGKCHQCQGTGKRKRIAHNH